MKYVFTCAEHEDFGSLGWRLKSQPDFDPLTGMAVAHDILEHFPGGDGSPADEFQALGASIHVRDGYYANGTAGDNIGSDFPEIMRHIIYEHMHLNSAPRTNPCDSWVEAEITKAINVLERELEYMHLEPDELASVRRCYPDIRGWMRVGYRKALKRYKGLYKNDIQRLFREIEQEADRRLKYAEEGAELTVSLTLTALKAKITMKEALEGDWA